MSVAASPGVVSVPARKPGPAWWPLATLVAGIALFLSPAWVGGGLFLARDDGRMHVPVKQFLATELAAGRLPEWNPYLGLGAPVIGPMVDAVQHPLTLLLLVLPAAPALQAWILLSLAGAALGAFWWARVLGASRPAALLAGFAFALSGPVVSATDNVTYLTALATLPAFFAAAHLWIVHGGARRLALLAAMSYLLAASGDAQCWGFGVVAVPLLAVGLGDRAPAGRRFLRGLGAAAAAAVAAAPVLLPLALWLPHSSRAGAVDEIARHRWALAPVRLLELGVPYLLRAAPGARIAPLHVALADATSPVPWALSVYLGATTLLLGVLGAFQGRRERLLLAGFLVSAWMALGHHAGFGQLAASLPVLRGLRYWEKMAPWAALLLAATAALAADRLDGDRRLSGRLAVAAAVAAALALGATLLPAFPLHDLPAALRRDLGDNLRSGLVHAAALCVVLALGIVAARRRRAIPVVLAAVVGLDLAAANVGAYELQSPAALVSAGPLATFLRARPGLERVVTPFEPLVDRRGFTANEATNLLGARTLVSAWNVGAGIGNFETYTGAAPARAAEIEQSLAPARWLPTVGLWGVGHVVVPGRLEALRALGLAGPLQVDAEDASTPAWLVRVPHRPRVYLAERVREATPREALAFALDPVSAGGDLTVVEGPVPGLPSPAGGQAAVIAETSRSVRVAVRAPGPSLLVLNDTWAPGWTALVDGAPVPVLRANYLVRAISVPAGTHDVLFRYSTPGLLAGWLVALAGVLGLFLLGWRERRRGSAADPGRAPGARAPIRGS